MVITAKAALDYHIPKQSFLVGEQQTQLCIGPAGRSRSSIKKLYLTPSTNLLDHLCPTCVGFPADVKEVKVPYKNQGQNFFKLFKEGFFHFLTLIGWSHRSVTLTGLSSASDPHLSPSCSPSLRRAVTSNLLPHVEASCPPHRPCLWFLTSLCPSLTPAVQCPTLSLLLQ